jgi:DNA polymerase III delta subunit
MSIKAHTLNSDTTLNAGVYLIEGGDAFWVSHAVNFFKAIVPNDFSDFDLKVIDNLASFAEITDALETCGFGTKVVIVNDESYKEKAAEKGELEKIISQVFADFLVFVNVGFLTPSLKKKVNIINAGKLETYDLKAVLLKKLQDVKMEPRAVDLLIEYTACDMAKIDNEIKKLRAYAAGKPVTAQCVRALVPCDIENEMFELTGALSAGNNKPAAEMLDRFLSRGISYSYILSALTSQYRRMLHCAISKKTDLELSSVLGIKEYAVKKTRENAKKYTKQGLKKMLETLTEAEVNFKSGVMSEETAFKKAIAKLIS